MEDNTIAIAYIPVMHQGYFAYLKMLENDRIEALYLVSDEILSSHETLDYIHRKDRLRALPHDVMKQMVAVCSNVQVYSLTNETITALQNEKASLVTPDEDINRFIVETYFSGHSVKYHSVFLRWNKNNVSEDSEPQGETITLEGFEKEVMGKVIAEAEKSADWWRRVGAALVKEDELIALAHNEHMPEKELPNIYGDSRSLFKKGINIEYVTSSHAEVSVIGEAVRKGISTEGAELFVTDFPCPYCARLIAKSGIKKIYFLHGYAVLGGGEFFKEMDIEIVKVDLREQENRKDTD